MAVQLPSEDDVSPSVIAETALRILDAHGVKGLSFRSLATALGTNQMKIHRRCGDLEGLLDLTADHLAARLPDFDTTAPWPHATERHFAALYELMCAHPALIALRGGRPWLGEVFLARMVEPCLAANTQAGMPPGEAIAAYRRMYLFTLGAAMLVNHRTPQQAQSRTGAVIANLAPERFPTLKAMRQHVVDAVTDHEVYRSGLRQLIRAADPKVADQPR